MDCFAEKQLFLVVVFSLFCRWVVDDGWNSGTRLCEQSAKLQNKSKQNGGCQEKCHMALTMDALGVYLWENHNY